MEQKYHSMIEKKFADYLITIGYPKDSIIYEPAFLSSDDKYTYRPDFIIIDPVKKERLAIIEIKSANFKDTNKAYAQLAAYSKTIGNDKIPVFLVTESTITNRTFPFDLYVFNIESGLIPCDFSLFPTFTALIAEDSAERKIDLQNKKTETLKNFQNVSWIMSLILFAIIIADFICSQYKIVLLTTERMALLGACVALIIIPFAQKFKGLGIEWEKATNENNN